MNTTLDMALIRWSVMCRVWNDMSSGHAPMLGAFLAGWFMRDMGAAKPVAIGVFRDSFYCGWRECDDQLAIMEQQETK